MNIKEYIEKYALTKGKVIGHYLIGNEDRLFLTEEHDDIRRLTKSNKKETRMFFYRVNYFLSLFFLLLILGNLFTLSFEWAVFNMIFFSWVFIKPLVHFFALKNKTKKKNIYIYRKFYSND